jgi:hypothetical protein
MRSFAAALLAGVSTEVFAHPGYGLVVPHFHSAECYVLVAIAAIIAAAIAAFKLK